MSSCLLACVGNWRIDAFRYTYVVLENRIALEWVFWSVEDFLQTLDEPMMWKKLLRIRIAQNHKKFMAFLTCVRVKILHKSAQVKRLVKIYAYWTRNFSIPSVQYQYNLMYTFLLSSNNETEKKKDFFSSTAFLLRFNGVLPCILMSFLRM